MKPFQVVVALLFTLAPALPAPETEPVRIVFLHGDRSHASGAHEFRAGSMLLAKCLGEQNAVAVKCDVHAGWPSTGEGLALLDAADAIVFYNDGTKIVGQGWEKVDQLAKSGTGLLFMHYAVHPDPANGERYFKPWMGGYFKDGESVNPFWKADIKTLIGHPTAEGVEEISTIDEFYHSISFSETAGVQRLGIATPTAENLATINNLWTRTGYGNVGKPQPLLWGIERPDGGRGAGFTGGHFHHNWAYDELRQLLLNTIIWTAGAEIPEGGVPVRPITEDELNANLDDYGDQTARLALPTPENRPRIKSNGLLTVEEHAKAKKKNSEWLKQKKALVDSLIVPVK